MKFADILKQIGTIAEEDKTSLLAIAEKYPDLDNHIVPASEFNSIKTRFAEADGKAKGWENWAYGPEDPATGNRTGGNWDAEHKTTRREVQTIQELAQARASIAEMAAGNFGGGEMDMKAITDHIASLGYVRADDLKGLAKSEDVDKRLNTHGGNLEYIFTRTANLPLRYMKEFGDADFDMEKFIGHMTSNPEFVQDPNKAYEVFVAPKRFEVERKKLADERTALATEREALEQKRISPNSPTDTGGIDGPSLAPFQKMVQGQDKDDKKLAEGVPFGTGQLGNELGKLWRESQHAKVN